MSPKVIAAKKLTNEERRAARLAEKKADAEFDKEQARRLARAKVIAQEHFIPEAMLRTLADAGVDITAIPEEYRKSPCGLLLWAYDQGEKNGFETAPYQTLNKLCDTFARKETALGDILDLACPNDPFEDDYLGRIHITDNDRRVLAHYEQLAWAEKEEKSKAGEQDTPAR